MLEYRAEGLCRNANHLSREELSRCMASGEVLQSTALAYDTGHRLRFELGGLRGIMPFADCVDAAPGETVKDIAVLTRVGRPTCFVIMGTEFDDNGEEYYLLSRAEAQRRCRAQYLDTLEAGSVIPCTVTHIENFGAFCDIGCGASGLLGLRNLCVSRLTHPGDLLRVGQRLPVLIQSLDPARRRVALTLQELLGTWEENAARFRPGQSVPGVVCGKTDYGVFIALTPNLCGLAERDDTLEPGQPVCVYIKAIHPETLKLKLTVLHRLDTVPSQPLRFTKTEGRLDVWRYGSREHAKNVTVF